MQRVNSVLVVAWVSCLRPGRVVEGRVARGVSREIENRLRSILRWGQPSSAAGEPHQLLPLIEGNMSRAVWLPFTLVIRVRYPDTQLDAKLRSQPPVASTPL